MVNSPELPPRHLIYVCNGVGFTFQPNRSRWQHEMASDSSFLDSVPGGVRSN